MMATYCFFLIILCAGGAFSILSCAAEAFSLDCTVIQPESQCCGFSTFLQPEGQCRGLKALHGHAITFNGSSALDQIAVPAARKSNIRSNANKTEAMDGVDDAFVHVSTCIPLDPRCTSMFVVELCVAVATVHIVIMLYSLTMLRKITKKRSFQHHDEPCPQLHVSRKESAREGLGSRSITPRPCSATIQKDYDLSGRKGYVETPANSEGISNANVRDKCKTTQYSSQNPPLTPEKYPTNQNGNLDEISNSQILDDIRELKERMACKICLGRDMCVVFLPCNHMVTCENCSVMLHRCAVCRTVIKGTFTVYTQF